MAHFHLPRFVVAALLLPGLAIGCSSPNSPPSAQLPTASTAASPTRQIKVIATFLPMYLFTKAVAGNAATVEILLQPGTEVHEYQSTPTDVQAIAQADVIVKNGLGMETFLEGTLKSAENAKLTVIDASQGIAAIADFSPVVGADGTAIAESDQPTEAAKATPSDRKAATHSHIAGNPHVWLSPVLAQKQVETIRDGLVAADPANQTTYRANAAAYIQQLSDLNNQFAQSLKPFRNQTFITFHDAFPYLAKQYDLKQVAVVQIPEDQLTPADLQATVQTVKAYQVKALLSEPGVDNKLLTTLAQDLRVTVRPLDSLEAGELDPQYYFKAMKNNLQTLTTAFQ